jgi:hypothetical protein
MSTVLAFEIGDYLNWGPKGTVNQTFPTLGQFISLLIRNAITISGVLLLALVIFGGVMFIISAGSGDAKKAELGKTALTDAVIGFAIIFCSYFIIQIIQKITGVPILNSGL